MSGWQVCDLALCVALRRTWGGGKVGPLGGAVYTVSGVTCGKTKGGLRLAEFPNWHNPLGFAQRWFVKVTPPEADEFDREVIEHLTGASVKEKA